jgi:hypothetical protein
VRVGHEEDAGGDGVGPEHREGMAEEPAVAIVEREAGKSAHRAAVPHAPEHLVERDDGEYATQPAQLSFELRGTHVHGPVEAGRLLLYDIVVAEDETPAHGTTGQRGDPEQSGSLVDKPHQHPPGR